MGSLVLIYLCEVYFQEFLFKRDKWEYIEHKAKHQDFPGGLVAKNVPADAGDTGSISSPGRSQMPWGN